MSSQRVGLPSPVYVLPSSFAVENLDSAVIQEMAASYLGHMMASELIALVTIGVFKVLGKYLPNSPYPAAWDDFVRNDIPKHWAAIKLKKGEAYAGIIKYADISVHQGERDIVLSEPARYDKEKQVYSAVSYQGMFLPAGLISSIAVVTDPDRDNRVTPIGSTLFQEEG